MMRIARDDSKICSNKRDSLNHPEIESTPLYPWLRAALTTAALVLLASSLLAQVIRVTDEESGSPIPGAVISLVEGTRVIQREVTDQSGEVRGLPAGNIRIEAVGYTTQDDRFDGKINLWIGLKAAAIGLNQAVVTAQNDRVKARDAVQRIQVIDLEQMRAVGAVTVSDVLARSSNVAIQQDASLGAQISLLGMDGQQVKVLINGVPVIGRLDGNIDLDQLALNDVQRIEVVEGPLSVEYGTDALAGTINIITKDAAARWGGSMFFQAGTDERSEMNAALQGKAGKTGWRLSARRNYFDGFQTDASTRTYTWKPKEQLSARLDWKRPLKRGNWGGDVEWFEETLWSDGPVQYQLVNVAENDSVSSIYQWPFAVDQRFITTRLNARLRGEWRWNERVKADGFVAANHYGRQSLTVLRDLVDLTEQPFGASSDNDTTVFLTLASRAKISGGEQLPWTLGYDVSYEQSLGDRLEDEFQDYVNAAVFAKASFKKQGWHIQPGLRYQYNSAFEAPLIPSLHVRWGRENWTVRASYGRGFRAPSLKELYFFFVDSNHNIQGNTDLQAETSHSIQASARREFQGKSALFGAELQGFHNTLSDLITLALTDDATGLFQYVNISEQTNFGFQGGADCTFLRWTLRGSLTHFWRSSFIDPSDPSLRQSTTQINGSVDWDWKRLKTQLNLTYTHFGSQQTYVVVDESVEANVQDAYGMLSTSAARAFLGDRLRIQCGINNLLDVTNINQTTAASTTHGGGSSSIPVGLGRTYYFSCGWTFNQ